MAGEDLIKLQFRFPRESPIAKQILTIAEYTDRGSVSAVGRRWVASHALSDAAMTEYAAARSALAVPADEAGDDEAIACRSIFRKAAMGSEITSAEYTQISAWLGLSVSDAARLLAPAQESSEDAVSSEVVR